VNIQLNSNPTEQDPNSGFVGFFYFEKKPESDVYFEINWSHAAFKITER
jgi:hypothetical protein